MYHIEDNEQSLTNRREFDLPLSLAGRIVPAKKMQTHQITLDTNKVPPDTTLLFEDLGVDPETQGILSSNKNVLTFQYTNGQEATLLISKTSGRYRIISSSFEAMFLLTNELVKRLQIYMSKEKEPLKILFNDNLPLKPYLKIIEEHYKVLYFLIFIYPNIETCPIKGT